MGQGNVKLAETELGETDIVGGLNLDLKQTRSALRLKLILLKPCSGRVC